MITKVFYYILLIPISCLPYRILYLFSDFLFFIFYSIIGYRKKIVSTNLKNSFPDKTDKELKVIMHNFYKHFCDLILEGLKGFTISEKQLKERLIIKNPEFINYYAKKNQSIILVGGHYNNWEIYAQAFSIYSNHKCMGIYNPLSNAFMNIKMYQSRSRFGTHLISMKQTKKLFQEEASSDPKAIVFGADQNPSNPMRAHWLKFLHQDTAVVFGVEKYSKEYNCPVVFISIKKTKRGYYEVEYSVITENPTKEPYGKITEDFTKRLEEDIINNPQYWLWTHRRWKHKKEE